MSIQLPRTQVAVLEAASATDPKPIEQLAEETDHNPDAVAGAAFALAEEGLLAIEEESVADVTLTEEGRRYVADGLPERRLYRTAVEHGADAEPVELGTLIGAAGLEGEAADVALANYARKGYGEIEDGAVTAASDADPEADAEQAALDALAEGAADVDPEVLDRLERRNLIERRDHTVRRVTLTDEGVDALMLEGVEAAERVDALTSELLTTGEWRDVEFAEYNVEADAPATHGATLHPLRQMARRLKDVLVGMGFKEMQGPHADAEFYINDCLFMPQDHPARTHWDQFMLDVPPMQELPEALVERVKRAHLEGVGPDSDGYHSPWTEEVARGIALRGHTTSLSVRHLAGLAQGDLEPPQRWFSVEKAYRNDELDATHLLEFFQIEGWVMAEDLTVRDLMGTFTELYAQFGITDLEFKPTYNPYTEPSFELFGRHPTTGELIEVGNSGIFRPEMLEPLEIEADVMAWGLALERLMMLFTGAEDIRDVHGTLVDMEYLRSQEVIE